MQIQVGIYTALPKPVRARHLRHSEMEEKLIDAICGQPSLLETGKTGKNTIVRL